MALQPAVAEDLQPAQETQKKPELRLVTPEYEAEMLLEKGPEALSQRAEEFSREEISGVHRISELTGEDQTVAPMESNELRASEAATIKEVESAHEEFDAETQEALSGWRQKQEAKQTDLAEADKGAAEFRALQEAKAASKEAIAPKQEPVLELEDIASEPAPIPLVVEKPKAAAEPSLELDFTSESRTKSLEQWRDANREGEENIGRAELAAEESEKAVEAFTSERAGHEMTDLEKQYVSYLEKQAAEARAGAAVEAKLAERTKLLMKIAASETAKAELADEQAKATSDRDKLKPILDKALADLKPMMATFQQLEARHLKGETLTEEDASKLERLRKDLPDLQKSQLNIRESLHKAEESLEGLKGAEAGADRRAAEANAALNSFDGEMKGVMAAHEAATKEREGAESAYTASYNAYTEAEAAKAAGGAGGAAGGPDAAVAAAAAGAAGFVGAIEGGGGGNPTGARFGGSRFEVAAPAGEGGPPSTPEQGKPEEKQKRQMLPSENRFVAKAAGTAAMGAMLGAEAVGGVADFADTMLGHAGALLKNPKEFFKKVSSKFSDSIKKKGFFGGVWHATKWTLFGGPGEDAMQRESPAAAEAEAKKIAEKRKEVGI